jgi:apolipoprotein N-acyltransferase
MLRSQHAKTAPALLATPRQRVIAFLLASATALLTAAPSFYEALWPLAWVALVPLFVALREASPKRALLLGWWAETLMYWVGFYWLIGTMVRFGFIAVPVSVCFFAIIGLGNSIRLGGAGSRGAGATEYPSGTTA